MEAVCDGTYMEQYRSGHNGHDWKSCVPQKGTEGSNPSCSARKPIRKDGFYFYCHFSDLVVYCMARGGYTGR